MVAASAVVMICACGDDAASNNATDPVGNDPGTGVIDNPISSSGMTGSSDAGNPDNLNNPNNSSSSAGTIILGLPSTGLHTNGYSLARKVLFDVAGYKVDTLVDGMDKTIGEALAVPHRSYYPSLIDLCNKKIIQGLAHITGSGYQGNIPRILPDNVDVIIDRTTWDPPMIFKLIQQAGSVEKDEMYSTFNMGMGMLIFIDPADKAEVVAHLEAKGEKWVQIGEVVEGTKQVKFRD